MQRIEGKLKLITAVVVLVVALVGTTTDHGFPPTMFKVQDLDIQKGTIVIEPYLSPRFLTSWHIDNEHSELKELPIKGEVLHCTPDVFEKSHILLHCSTVNGKPVGDLGVVSVMFAPEQP